MNVYEMEGFLRGKCLPGDMKVNESNAQYLVRIFSEMQSQNAELAVQLANAESKCRELAVENAALKATCDDRRTFIMNGVQLGYIKVPTVDTDPALETIRIAVSPQAPTPATDAFLDEVRASALEYYANLFKDTVNMDVKHNQEFHKGTLYVADQISKGAAHE
ncbi:hNH endonuclease [Citrobacter freundii]|uniref:hNH endonuclease n=1 Tax=Citrobacter freundii TaxID=546 RepID=UPI002874C40A|nr:hNH endonuclease [Citrobacter freundii]MDS0960157.1 hNH endonuclease [Citrobacter freundii]